MSKEEIVETLKEAKSINGGEEIKTPLEETHIVYGTEVPIPDTNPHKDSNHCFLCQIVCDLITIQFRMSYGIVGELYMCASCEEKHGQHLTFNPLTLWEDLKDE